MLKTQVLITYVNMDMSAQDVSVNHLFVNQDMSADVSVNRLYVNRDMSAQDVSVNRLL